MKTSNKIDPKTSIKSKSYDSQEVRVQGVISKRTPNPPNRTVSSLTTSSAHLFIISQLHLELVTPYTYYLALNIAS